MGFSEQIKFLSKLIQYGPVYGSEGQLKTAKAIENQLNEFGWDRVWLQKFKADDLSSIHEYIPVSNLSSNYIKDANKEKLNVIAIADSGKPGPTLILNGHYDVEPIIDSSDWIESWNSGLIKNGKIWGRGASDMLGGLTSQIYIASEFARQKKKWKGKIIFTAVTDEEIGGNGTLSALLFMRSKGLINDSENTYCLIAEPSNQVIANETLGFMHMIIKVSGLARHIAGATRYDNALYSAIELINEFDKVIEEITKMHGTPKNDMIYNFGVIKGGVDAATPIDSISLEATVFYPSNIEYEKLKRFIIDQIQKKNIRLSIRFSDFYFNGQRSPSNSLSRALIHTTPNKGIVMGKFNSPCDARLFDAFGIKNVITYGPGSLAQAHTVNEFIKIENIEEYNTHIAGALKLLLKE